MPAESPLLLDYVNTLFSFERRNPDFPDKEWLTREVVREIIERLSNRCSDMKVDEVDEAKYALRAFESEPDAVKYPDVLVKLLKDV